jgi:hypothetical protein
LTNGQCRPICKDGFCTNCTTPDICVVCRLGYAPGSDGVCIKNSCFQYCTLCRADKTCITCNSSMNLTLTNGSCIPVCNPNCINCTNPLHCANCAIGYDVVSISDTSHETKCVMQCNIIGGC